MYLDFFSFAEKPFDITPNTRFFYFSPQHEEAIETLLYGIHERRGFMVLTGEVGTGKTTSIRALLNRLGDEVETALIVNPLLSTLQLLKTINQDFGTVSKGNSIQGEIESLNDYLLESAKQGRNAVVIIDEAQDLSLEALEMIRLLSNLETETHKLLQLILVGQPELDDKLNQEELRQLCQRIQIRHTLHPLNLEETQRYVLYRINQAAPKCCLAIQPSAFKKIHDYSGGIPRLINSIGDLVLMAAYVGETHVITSKIVEIAAKEMGDQSGSHPFSLLKRLGQRRGDVSSP